MIVRAFVPALAIALPLAVDAQAPRARWSAAEHTTAEAPMVRVWIPGSWSLRFGAPVGVSFEVSEAAHVAVFRVDASGQLTVLWPERNSLQTAVRAGRDYRVTGPRSSQFAFAADYEIGQGMVLAIASSDPIDLTPFKQYRNDVSYHRYVNSQRPYIGGVKSIVNRITQEILYAVDSPYDYDIAFYSVGGNRFFASTYCDNHFTYFNGVRYPRMYGSTIAGYGYGDWDDCYGSSLYGGYLAYCNAWQAFSGYFNSAWCRYGNPFWPSSPGPIAGGPQQPQQPRPNIDMIDTIMSRPVDGYPLIDRKTEQAGNGTTHVVTMEPVRDAPNGTRWLPADDTDAISLPSRFRREPSDPGRQGGRINTRDEGLTRGPGGGLRVDDPRVGDRPPTRSPGSAFMPPVREAPRPITWRDRDSDRGTSSTAPQRWERPTMAEPRSPSRSGGDSRIDRGSSSTGTSSPSPAPAATMTPRTDASVTKTEGSKAPDAKSSGERKP